MSKNGKIIDCCLCLWKLKAVVKRSFQNKLMAAAVKYMGQPNEGLMKAS